MQMPHRHSAVRYNWHKTEKDKKETICKTLQKRSLEGLHYYGECGKTSTTGQYIMH